MSTQFAIDLPPARAAGARRALEHAGNDWKNDAYTFLLVFAKARRPGELFTGEDVSDAHIAAGHPQPPDLRAWGPLYQVAARRGFIRRVDNNGCSRRRASPCPRYEARNVP